jgi:hypothetical protein
MQYVVVYQGAHSAFRSRETAVFDMPQIRLPPFSVPIGERHKQRWTAALGVTALRSFRRGRFNCTGSLYPVKFTQIKLFPFLPGCPLFSSFSPFSLFFPIALMLLLL